MDRKSQPSCPDCESLNRREFVAKTTGTAVAVSAASVGLSSVASAAPSRKSAAETAVRKLYDSLNDKQKKLAVLPLTDARRKTINPNWHITKMRYGMLTGDQKEICNAVLKGITSEDGYDRFLKQMKHDAGSINTYSFALFGNPHEKEFEFEWTGRHLTLRADGNTKKGVAFGGPIVYGHGAKGNSKKNLFSYQTMAVNKVFKMLDEKQREKALLKKAPSEGAVKLRKKGRRMPGISVGDLSSDQQGRFEKSLRAVMKPYRKEDVDEVMEIVKASGGLKKVSLAFYQTGDLNKDKVWDIWRIEGPSMVCHFRGAPHVHAYINIAKRS